VNCVVESTNELARSVTLRAHPKAVTGAIVRGGKLAFSSLTPGLLVDAVVDEIIQVRHYYHYCS
jgi:hypothetical protein